MPLSSARSIPPTTPNRDYAILAAGCFWGVEQILRETKGVLDTQVGYTGGLLEGPKYSSVKTGSTGHAEAVWIEFDPQLLSYEALLHLFFRLHDPTQMNRQQNDIGSQYRSAIFYLSDEQKRIAQAVRDTVDRSGRWGKPIVTQILAAGPFWDAEEEHQDYLRKNPQGYNCHWLREE